MAEISKKQNFFVRFGRKLSKFFREMKSELRKVVWPSVSQMRNNTIIVLVAVLIVGIIVCSFDLLAGGLMSLLQQLF
ncbi:MAG: preprotein translocase subunit SecE [Oscillospiraceae bacterium]|jgi:preprotein translocase subunit SecE|nr:preprotein translocase subunit SecE [Oscillospiraceae bacterium]